jgi:hypothetical protein
LKWLGWKNMWRADPLVWGRGPRAFEVFLEPTCPFSVKAFGKLDELLGQAGEDHITIKLRLQSQPWHMYSGVIVRCILAAPTLVSGKAAAKSRADMSMATPSPIGRRAF